MDRNVFALSLGLAGLLLLPTLARATQAQRSNHDMVAAQRAQQFNARPPAMGLAQDVTVMELYASDQGT